MKTYTLVSLILSAVPALAAPTERRANPEPAFIEGKYIVQLKPGTSPEAVTSHYNTVHSLLLQQRYFNGSAVGGSIDRTFQIGDNFIAYSGTFDDATLAAISELDEVLAVERDQVIRIDPIESTSATLPASVSESEGTSTTLPASVSVSEERSALTTQVDSIWSLGDLSHHDAGATEYVYDETAGEGTTAYVIDSGIRRSHDEFEGRVSFGINAVTNSTVPKGTNSDMEGHGTFVAATIAGKTYGVAKKAKVIDVLISEGARV